MRSPHSRCVKFVLDMGGGVAVFGKGTAPPEMFVWLHLINLVTVDSTGAVDSGGTRSACC